MVGVVDAAVAESESRVAKVAAGQAQFAELTPAERQAAHALIDSRIARRAAAAQFGRPPRTTA